MDVGGSHVTTGLITREGDRAVLLERRVTTIDSAGSRQDLLDQLVVGSESFSAQHWVVALPGPFDYPLGRGDFAGVSKFGSLAGVDLRAELSRRLRVATDSVCFVNDAVAYAVGEWSLSPDPAERFVCITLGTGVGSAWLADGAPVDSGPLVPPHGWVHLLTVNGRPLEDTVSTRAIVAEYAQLTGSQADVKAIAGSARAGDEAATASLNRAFRGLGRAVGPFLRGFGTERLVVGGAMARAWDLIEGPLSEGVSVHGGSPVPMVPSMLIDDAPLLGAAEWFRRRRPADPFLARTP